MKLWEGTKVDPFEKVETLGLGDLRTTVVLPFAL